MMKKMLTGMARKLRDTAKKKLPEPPKKAPRPRLSNETAAKVLALHIEQATYGRWK